MYKIYLNRNSGEFGVTKTSWNYYINCYSLTEAIKKWFLMSFNL